MIIVKLFLKDLRGDLGGDLRGIWEGIREESERGSERGSERLKSRPQYLSPLLRESTHTFPIVITARVCRTVRRWRR